MPRRSAGWMGQRNQIEGSAIATDDEFSTNDILQLFEGNKLGGGESADSYHESWFQNCEFLVHPRRAISNFLGDWYPVGAAGRFSGKTAADSCEINAGAHDWFSYPAEFFKPAEERFAGGVGERPF